MSKYIDSLKSESPVSLYVFDQNPPGTVTDQGYSSQDLTLVEDGITAKTAPSIIPGVRWSVWPRVSYNGTSTGESVFTKAVWSEWTRFATLNEDAEWTVEAVVLPGTAETSDSTFYGNAIWAFVDGNVADMGLHITSDNAGNWRLSFRMYFEDLDDPAYEFNDIYDVITYDLGAILESERLHVVVTKTSRTFRMYVNSQLVGDYEYGPNSQLAGTRFGWDSDALYVGGVTSGFRHSDVAAVGSLTFIGSVVPYGRISERYGLLSETSEDVYETIVGGFGSVMSLFPSGNGKSTLQPELDQIAAGMDEDNLQYLPADSITILPASLSPAVTFYKKQYFDLTDIDYIGRVYHNFSATTGANSSVVAEYSFDDISYSTLPTGDDAVPEIKQDWAQAAEGTL